MDKNVRYLLAALLGALTALGAEYGVGPPECPVCPEVCPESLPPAPTE